MNKYCMEWIVEWCQANEWTDPFQERKEYWAFPPHAVMPLPIPDQALQSLKAEKGLSPAERLWVAIALVVTTIAATTGLWFDNPMPMVVAFVCCALIVAGMDDE